MIYNKDERTITKNGDTSYIYDCNDYYNHELYFACKNKKELTIENIDMFYSELFKKCSAYFDNYDIIVIPESSSNFIKDFAEMFNKRIVIVEKNDIATISDLVLSNNKLSKNELASHNKRFNEMNGVFKINKIKVNKRDMYCKYMFKKSVNTDGKVVVVVDDFICSGSTISGIKQSLGIECDVFSIFTKKVVDKF